MIKKKGIVWKHWMIITDGNTEEDNSFKKKVHLTVCCNYCSKVFE
jgi:hypothetical protein